jgi:hypothetical protein
MAGVPYRGARELIGAVWRYSNQVLTNTETKHWGKCYGTV